MVENALFRLQSGTKTFYCLMPKVLIGPIRASFAPNGGGAGFRFFAAWWNFR
jgi:hypothetical protein